MKRSWRWLTGVTLLVAGLAGGRLVWAQSVAGVEITAPLPGATVTGVVAILGSAAPPQFQRYELAFSYDPDPTGTWFTLQPPAATPVTAGLLGRWDTTGLTAGLYVIRLRVYTSAREYVETLIRGVRVQSTPVTSQPALTPTPAAATARPTEQVVVVASATPAPVITLPPAPTARPMPGSPAGQNSTAAVVPGLNAQAAQTAFSAGAQVTFVIFGLLGVYQGARALVLSVWRRLRR